MVTHDDMERALREAEEKYRHIFENATEGIFQASTAGRFTSANPALARLHGYDSPSELIEAVSSIRDQLFQDSERHSELIRLLLESDAVTNFEARMRRKDGSEQWVSMNVRAFRNDEGRIVFYEGTMEDITLRKEGERALAESEERYRTVIEHSNDGIAFARGGIHEYVNPRFVAMYGYDSPEEIVGKPITLIVHPDDRERVLDIHARRWKGQPVPARYEHKGITRAGATIYVEVSAAGATYRNEPILIVFQRDISERNGPRRSSSSPTGSSSSSTRQRQRPSTTSLTSSRYPLRWFRATCGSCAGGCSGRPPTKTWGGCSPLWKGAWSGSSSCSRRRTRS